MVGKSTYIRKSGISDMWGAYVYYKERLVQRARVRDCCKDLRSKQSEAQE